MYLSETAKRKAERRKIKAYQKERGLKIDLIDEIEVAKMIKHQTCVGNITSHSSQGPGLNSEKQMQTLQYT